MSVYNTPLNYYGGVAELSLRRIAKMNSGRYAAPPIKKDLCQEPVDELSEKAKESTLWRKKRELRKSPTG